MLNRLYNYIYALYTHYAASVPSHPTHSRASEWGGWARDYAFTDPAFMKY